MIEQLQQLIEKARSGEAQAFEELMSAVRAAGDSDMSALLMHARSEEPLLRRAFIELTQNRKTPDIVEAINQLVHDPDGNVRAALAQAAGRGPAWPSEEVFGKLLHDDEGGVRLAAVRTIKGRRPGLEAALLHMLHHDVDWQVRQAIASCLARGTPTVVLSALLTALAQDNELEVSQACVSSIEAQLRILGGYPNDVEHPRLSILEEAQRRLDIFGAEASPLLCRWLAERVANDVEVERLRGFGSVLSLEVEAGKLPRAYGIETACATVRRLLTGVPPRAVVLLGEPGSGKTALVQELTHHLHQDPSGAWHVLQVTPSELLAGTTYLGEWQTKVRDLVQAVRFPRRVVLYVPNLEELSQAGMSSRSDSNVATALAPFIERGEIVIVGESTPEAFRGGLGAVGSLRRLFHVVEVKEADLTRTRAILRRVRDEVVADISDIVLDRLVELADFYLVGTAQPGRSVGLLRRVLGAAAGREGPVTERDILQTLSSATGIPVDYLDDEMPLDRGKVRAFFEARVMGQPEAVDAVLERVALVKAGLTDPHKPFGVLFFIGPTGVGKTELARSLAELLFGDPNRLVRIDMSEFATHDAHERLLGWSTKPGVLTAAVRERPFSVLLFDEIEKAHSNVFDLCLQLFDAGRLSDMQGRVADFRRSLIILTSNLGSAVDDEAGFGFFNKLAPAVPDSGAILREMSRWFRPEFLNRLDRIVTFRPLSADTAEQIARREVDRVLERSGIARRRLAVDVDPAVLALLLKEGYSPTFGARPLKRTVERMVLMPVAWAIASGEAPVGSMLRLGVRGGRIHVEVIAPEPAEPGASPPAERATPVAARAQSLQERIARLRTEAEPLAARRAELLARTAEANFYADNAAARQVLDDIYRLDGVLRAFESLARDVRDQSERARHSRRADHELAPIGRKLDALSNQAEHVAFLLSCRDLRDLGDAFVTLTRVQPQGKGLDGVALLARMYMGLARRRGFECEVLDDHQGGAFQEDTITLQITGAGAHALLAGEMGLHQFVQGHGQEAGKHYKEREIVRVDVLRVPASETNYSVEDLRIESRVLEGATGRLLEKPNLEIQLQHRPTMLTVRACTRGNKAQASKQLRPLLQARIDALNSSQPAGNHQLIRRYSLSPTTKVYDVRLRRSTPRLDQVLKGHIEPFLHLPGRSS